MKSVHCFFTHCQSLPKFFNHQIVVSITVHSPERSDMKYTVSLFHAYQNTWLRVLPSGDVLVNLWMIWCGDSTFWQSNFWMWQEFTTLTPISLLISCKLLCQIVGLKISSRPTSTLRSPKKCSYGIQGIYCIHILVPHWSCPLYCQLCHLLGHEHLTHWYHTSDLLVLCTTLTDTLLLTADIIHTQEIFDMKSWKLNSWECQCLKRQPCKTITNVYCC
jgi:hypothetical protein